MRTEIGKDFLMLYLITAILSSASMALALRFFKDREGTATASSWATI